MTLLHPVCLGPTEQDTGTADDVYCADQHKYVAVSSLHGEHVLGHVKADEGASNAELEQPAKAVQLRRQVLALLAAVAEAVWKQVSMTWQRLWSAASLESGWQTDALSSAHAC